MIIKSRKELEKRYLEFLLEESNKEFIIPVNTYEIVFGDLKVDRKKIELMDSHNYKEYKC